MLAFDFPIPFTSVGRRTVSNVPAQALVMMNDPFVVEEAKRWGETVAKQPGTAQEKIAGMFEKALARPPSERQMQRIQAFINEQSRLYGGKTNAPELWADVGHMIFNMKSFLYLD